MTKQAIQQQVAQASLFDTPQDMPPDATGATERPVNAAAAIPMPPAADNGTERWSASLAFYLSGGR